jgi:hypothetical protein
MLLRKHLPLPLTAPELFHDILVDLECRSGHSISILNGVHRIPLVATDSDGLTIAACHLDEVVCIVGDCHELGKGGETHNGIVGQPDVCDIEVDELCTIVPWDAEHDGEPHLPDGHGGTVRDLEKGFVALRRSRGTPSLLKALTERTFKPAPPSMRVQKTVEPQKMGEQTIGSVPTKSVVLG